MDSIDASSPFCKYSISFPILRGHLSLPPLLSMDKHPITNYVFHSTAKGGKISIATDQSKVLFEREGMSQAYAFSDLDYLLEWSGLDLRPDEKVRQLIAKYADVYDNNFPLHCKFTDGRSDDYCILHLTKFPPSSDNFNASTVNPRWYYFSQAKVITESPKAIPANIVQALNKMAKEDDRNLKKIMNLKGNLLENPDYPALVKKSSVVVQDDAGKYYKFSRPEIFVFDRYLLGSDLRLVDNASEKIMAMATELSLFDYNERSSYNDFRKIITVFADQE